MTIMIAVLAGGCCFASPPLPAQGAPRKDVVIEKSEALPGGGGLGTTAYSPTEREGPFLKKVTEKPVEFWSDVKIPKPSDMTDAEWAKFLEQERAEKAKAKAKSERIPQEKYQLIDQVGQVVGWFGILRETSRDDKAGVTSLLLEHKYFDGMIDLHQQIVSLYGAGDFTATLARKETGIPPLALVRVYGKVAKDKNGAPTIAAEHVRFWDWGLFAFMDYGKDKTNPKWQELRKIAGDKAYGSRPTAAYYEERLGKRESK